RQVLYVGSSVMLGNLLNNLIDAGSRDNMRQLLAFFAQSLQFRPDGEKYEMFDVKLGLMIDGTLVAGETIPEALALENLPGNTVGGDVTATNEQRYFLIKIAKSDTTSEFYLMGRSSQELPEVLVGIFHRFARSAASLWKQREAVEVS